MSVLPIVIAPNPIFKTKAQAVAQVDDEVRKDLDNMLETMYHEHAVGLGANMVGLLKRLVTVDLVVGGNKNPIIMANPEITFYSNDAQEVEEASLSFPGISALITRPKAVKVSYLSYEGEQKEMEAEGFLATVLQHEIDYLNGKVFLDYLSPLKKSMLLKKMDKYKKTYKPHVHTAACRH
jgi:peptide deformylase